jgi:hypothetical protein
MDNALQAILDNLPPRRRRSKLEPYAGLIRALRARGRSYREIVTILRDRCGLRVATHTVYHFVQARAQKQSAVNRSRPHPPAPAHRASAPSASSPSCPPDAQDDVWACIAAVKQRAPASKTDAPKTFVYDEHTPLQLIAEIKPPKR